MPRRVDYALKQRRDGTAAGLAEASRLADVMKDKCSQLLSETSAELGGDPIAEDMISRLRNSIDTLGMVRAQLLQAVGATHGIDVTVESDGSERW